MKSVDVAVVGAGVAGASLAWHLSRAHLDVALFDEEVVGAGASGRNAGSLIAPLDERLTPWFEGTVHQLTRGLEGAAGLLDRTGLIGLEADEAKLHDMAETLRSSRPDWSIEVLDAGRLRTREPAVAPGLHGLALEDAYTVDPLAVTRMYAQAAVAQGAELFEHTPARVALQGGRVVGVEAGEASRACDVVVVCSGADIGSAMPGVVTDRHVNPVWGVVASVDLPQPPGAILVEAAGLVPASSTADSGPATVPVEIGFGLVTRGATSSWGHSLSAQEPDPAAVVTALRTYADRLVPALGSATVRATRVCARPTSTDDLPVVGPVPGITGAYLLTGLGSRGLTIGPELARALAVSLDGGPELPVAFAPARFH